MATVILYIFVFSSWGLGLLSALSALAMALRTHSIESRSREMEIRAREGFMDTFRRMGNKQSGPGNREIPEALRQLIENSPGHPEVSEITDDDEVVGVVFRADSYPPSMEKDESDDQSA